MHAQVPAAFKMVTVQPCSVGQVQEVSQPVCTTCLPSTFSLDPEHYHCDACPANANCSGGAAFIPPEGSWHSGPNSTNIVECPHAAACQGNRSALLACKQVGSAEDCVHQIMCTCLVLCLLYTQSAYSIYSWKRGKTRMRLHHRHHVCQQQVAMQITYVTVVVSVNTLFPVLLDAYLHLV